MASASSGDACELNVAWLPSAEGRSAANRQSVMVRFSRRSLSRHDRATRTLRTRSLQNEGCADLKTHARTFRTAATARRSSRPLTGLDPDQWRLLTAEVRTDKGKFVEYCLDR